MARGFAVPDELTFWQDGGLDVQRRRVDFHYPMIPAQEPHHIGVDHVIRNLLWLDATGNDPVELWINCPGGLVDSMWALHDVIRSMESETITVAYGNVSSAACLVLASGTGTRYAMPHASFMWHQGTTGVNNELNQRDAQERAEWEQFEHQRWIGTMTKYTKKTYRYWESKAAGELWLDAPGMLKHGIIDEIWD